MNRRDIIVLAVLINVGLLVTLFVTSLKDESSVDVAAAEPLQELAQLPELESSNEKKGVDQVDQVIHKYTTLAKAKGEEKKEEPSPAPVLTPVQERKEVSFQPPTKALTRVVTVAKGDVLEKIARANGVSVDAIMKLNHLSNSRLQIGQELKIPEKIPPRQPLKREEVGKYYIVKGGDSPWTIAQKHHIQVEDLLRMNNIDEEKAKRLRPGDRLRIQ